MFKLNLIENLKKWWFQAENLFVFRIDIILPNIIMEFYTPLFGFQITTYIPSFYSSHVKTIFRKLLRFNKHKKGNIDLYFTYDLKTGITIRKNIHCDHTPFEFEISILGLDLIIYKYDLRSWDDDNDRYDNIEQGETT